MMLDNKWWATLETVKLIIGNNNNLRKAKLLIKIILIAIILLWVHSKWVIDLTYNKIKDFNNLINKLIEFNSQILF